MKNFIFLVLLICLSSFTLAAVYEADSEELPLYVGGYQCYAGIGYANIYNLTSLSNITIVNSTYSAGNCSLVTPWCCPTGSYCSSTTNKCVYNATNPVDDCSDLVLAGTCNTASGTYAYALLNKFNSSFAASCGNTTSFIDSQGLLGVNVTSCGCVWNSTLNKCSVTRNFNMNLSDNTGLNLDCSWIETNRDDQCAATASKLTIFYTASGSAVGRTDYCTNQVQEFPCDVSVKLPFFDSFTFILTGMAICVCYFVLNRRHN